MNVPTFVHTQPVVCERIESVQVEISSFRSQQATLAMIGKPQFVDNLIKPLRSLIASLMHTIYSQFDTTYSKNIQSWQHLS